MGKIKRRLEELTRLILAEENPSAETCKAYTAELAMLRTLISTWRAFDGYDGEIDPDASEDRPKRTSQTSWD